MKRAHKIGHCTSVAASTRQRGGANRAGSELNWGNSDCLVDSEELELGMSAVNQGAHRPWPIEYLEHFFTNVAEPTFARHAERYRAAAHIVVRSVPGTSRAPT